MEWKTDILFALVHQDYRVKASAEVPKPDYVYQAGRRNWKITAWTTKVYGRLSLWRATRERAASYSMEIEYHCFPPGLETHPYRRKIVLQVTNPDIIVLPCGFCLQLDDELSSHASYLVMESLRSEGFLPNVIELAELIRQSREISMNGISCSNHSLLHAPTGSSGGLFG
jgi:hypothetical protein